MVDNAIPTVYGNWLNILKPLHTNYTYYVSKNPTH